MATKGDELQRCINMIESLADAQSEAKNFRTHCHDIIKCAQSVHSLLIKVQKEHPDIVDADGANPIFHKLTDVVEEALLVIRKTATLSQMEKFFDHGESKHKLDEILASLHSAAREMDAFVAGFQSSKRTSQSSSTTGEGTPVVVDGAASSLL